MATKRQLDDDTDPNLSVWKIPASELPDRAGEVWGRCPEKHHSDLTTDTPAHSKVKQIQPRPKSANERAATA